MEQKGEILIYQSSSGNTQVEVRIENETVWLSQNQMAELFQTTKQNISLHIRNIFTEGELDENSTVKDYLTVQLEGSRKVKRATQFYNLDVIISVGYRVKSHIGTHFRIWATKRLKEYIIKGFVLDDERLKEARNNYFDELLSRIRDIRSSEKVFYRKVCDIYATSMDYDANHDLTRDFFATIQNKFHWAIHTHTAAELIVQRANASKQNMGLTNFPGSQIKKQDVIVAKNYLNEDELNQLNRIISQYLEFAELQALQRKPMYMKDWLAKLHGFLTLNDREILEHTGKVSHWQAEEFAFKEFEKYQKQLDTAQTDELDQAVKKLSTQKKK
ncbi:virulence RhuM family protein [Mucilaginibacter arboris]|uniref:Hydroxyacid dehydrogenase n=1 Tax=Mucilaginibacter arboris TaxID=2682090 RepID=A0A7K1SYL4_9SPHI|nr:virulence RhuM family protein [Mucilaginibacter arboris]MVN22414.1 hydroxyacid dehydrogenase [Mucilaginibacter arboris]